MRITEVNFGQIVLVKHDDYDAVVPAIRPETDGTMLLMWAMPGVHPLIRHAMTEERARAIREAGGDPSGCHSYRTGMLSPLSIVTEPSDRIRRYRVNDARRPECRMHDAPVLGLANPPEVNGSQVLTFGTMTQMGGGIPLTVRNRAFLEPLIPGLDLSDYRQWYFHENHVTDLGPYSADDSSSVTDDEPPVWVRVLSGPMRHVPALRSATYSEIDSGIDHRFVYGTRADLAMLGGHSVVRNGSVSDTNQLLVDAMARQGFDVSNVDDLYYYVLNGTRYEVVAAPEATLPATEPVQSSVTDQHRADIETISRILITEANDRGWCSEYDTIVERINEQITVPLLKRRQTYQITFTRPAEPQTEQGSFDTPPTREEVEAWVVRNYGNSAVVVGYAPED